MQSSEYDENDRFSFSGKVADWPQYIYYLFTGLKT